jgi:type I restriction enzyme S subunit
MSPLYTIFKFKEGNIDFFEQYFRTNCWHQYLKDKANFGARFDRMNISNEDFFNLPIPFPPLAEQRRIAACLSALDEMLAATNGKLEQLKAYKKGLMQNLFVSSMGGGKSLNINYLQIPKLRFPEFYDEKEWEEKKLGELTNTFSGGTPTASNKEYYGGDIPFIRSGEINSNSTELFLTQLGLENSAAKLVEKGTILYALYGATSGEVGIAKIGGAINQAILAIIPCEKLDPLFLFFSLQNQKDSIVNQYIQGGQGNLSGSIINSLNFSFPSLPEQRKIASCLFAMDDQINAYTEKVGLLGQYKKGLMQRMFPQNQMN